MSLRRTRARFGDGVAPAERVQVGEFSVSAMNIEADGETIC
jgi:hypothetical protein